MDRLVGTVLNNTYRIDKLLGQGGMGAVFRAHDVALDRDVAIKLMHSHISAQPGFRARFLQEARAIAALNHPGIVPIYTFSSDPEQLYIVMAFLQGQNLSDWLHLLKQRQQAISLPEALGIVEMVADALAYAHRRGVYHRDIKPGNVILQPLESGQVNEAGLSFQPIVTDFGLAKLAEGGIQSMAGLSMGTPAYMAPEQCEAAPVDGRADIYSLGIVLYEMVTGQVPFAVSTLTEALQAHTKEPPPPPRSLAPDLPSPVERIILKALAKRPEDRYQTASEMAEALRLVRTNTPKQELAATVAPTQAGYASLATMMSQEMPPPTPKDSAWPTPPSDIQPGAALLVLAPDGSSTAVAFGTRRALTIGRDPGNNVPLNDSQISRQHCQVSTDNGRFFITDLNSTNGTYLGDNKLLPGVAEPWRPGQTVRIGGHWLRLRITEGAVQAPPPNVSYAAGAPRTPTQPVSLTLEPERISVEPGKSTTVTLRVLNQQQQVDHFSPLVEQLPAEWVTLPAQPLRLAPGDTGTLTLRLTPPRQPTSASGDHVFDVRIISRADPTVSAQASGTLNVLPFRALNLNLQPSTFVNKGEGRLEVANQGNSPEAVELALADPSGVLDVPNTSRQITLQAGQRQQVSLPIKARGKRPLMGNPSTSSFQVQASAGGEQVAATQGNLTVKPYLPTWAIPILTTLVLLLCAGAALAYNNVQKNKAAQQTIIASAASQGTMTAEAIAAGNVTRTAQAVGAAQTATAQAMATAEVKAATEAALTATANYMASDEDNDGLTVAQELAYGTNPQNVDTDGDTLPDGEEVNNGTSPINKDTDGDGQQDNVDPSPGELPTLTPEPTDEPTETPPPTPEPTPVHTFAAGQELTFALSGADVGTINQVCIRHDNTGPEPDWYVESISIDGGDGIETYTFDRWLATDKADGNLEACKSKSLSIPTFSIQLIQPLLIFGTPTAGPTPTATSTPQFQLIQPGLILPKLTLVPLFHSYTVEVKTGAIEGAGTSAAVYVLISGDEGDTDWLLLQ